MQNTELAVKAGDRASGGTETKVSGGYEISYRVGPPIGLYEFSSGKLEWKEPQEENAHVDVYVHDADDGRFIPGLHLVATLLDSQGGQAASNHLPLVWHPEQSRYGSNVKLPKSGEYLLQVHVYPATFPRADKEQGQRYVADVHVSFEGVQIEV